MVIIESWGGGNMPQGNLQKLQELESQEDKLKQEYELLIGKKADIERRIAEVFKEQSIIKYGVYIENPETHTYSGSSIHAPKRTDDQIRESLKEACRATRNTDKIISLGEVKIEEKNGQRSITLTVTYDDKKLNSFIVRDWLFAVIHGLSDTGLLAQQRVKRDYDGQRPNVSTGT